MFKLAKEGAAREAGQKRKGPGEKSPARLVFAFVGLLEPWPVRLLAATTWRRAFGMVSGGLVFKLSNSSPQSPVIATPGIAGKIVLDSSDERHTHGGHGEREEAKGMRNSNYPSFRLAVGLIFMTVAVFAADNSPSPYLPTLSSYIQVRYTDPSEGDDTWAIRRLKLMLDGGPSDGLHYHLQFIYKTNLQSSTDDQVFLQDAYVIVPVSRGLGFKVGQFVPPFGLERAQPDWKLDLVDRTDVTNRMVVNGNLGKSFARDRGVEGDWTKGGFSLSAGFFQGEGANMNPKGNGPLGVIRCSYGRMGMAGDTPWFWRGGIAASDRRDENLNLSPELPGLSQNLTKRFAGRDSRLNAFLEGGWGKVRGQAEYFRAWLSPDKGGEIAASGAYGQIACLPVRGLIFAMRYEWFTPDAHEAIVPKEDLWTVGATVDIPKTSLRVACDYSHPTTVWPKTHGDVVRVQLQWFLPSWHVGGKDKQRCG